MSDYEKLNEIIEEANGLFYKNPTNYEPAFVAWYAKTERFLLKHYGKESIELSSFKKIRFDTVSLAGRAYEIQVCKDGLLAAASILNGYLREIEDENAPLPSASNLSFESVFIVHGHDGELKEAVARIVEKQGIHAVILSEQVNCGKTIIEKFEEYSQVGGAICLFTADDLSKVKSSDTMQPRARQNVVFETGYFMGKLGRENVVVLADNGIELPSDLSGVVYTSTKNWQFDLLKELKEMGYAIDLNKLL